VAHHVVHCAGLDLLDELQGLPPCGSMIWLEAVAEPGSGEVLQWEQNSDAPSPALADDGHRGLGDVAQVRLGVQRWQCVSGLLAVDDGLDDWLFEPRPTLLVDVLAGFGVYPFGQDARLGHVERHPSLEESSLDVGALPF
jgi:hypothetical protein